MNTNELKFEFLFGVEWKYIVKGKFKRFDSKLSPVAFNHTIAVEERSIVRYMIEVFQLMTLNADYESLLIAEDKASVRVVDVIFNDNYITDMMKRAYLVMLRIMYEVEIMRSGYYPSSKYRSDSKRICCAMLLYVIYSSSTNIIPVNGAYSIAIMSKGDYETRRDSILDDESLPINVAVVEYLLRLREYASDIGGNLYNLLLSMDCYSFNLVGVEEKELYRYNVTESLYQAVIILQKKRIHRLEKEQKKRK